MVSPAFLAQAKAMPAEDRWEIVDALLGTLDPGCTPDELSVARAGLRRYRTDPQDTVDAHEFIASRRRQRA